MWYFGVWKQLVFRLEEGTLRRRDFILLVGAAAVTWPLAALAQQPVRMRRIGILWILGESDPQVKKNREAFLTQLHRLGWKVGDNLSIDYRSAPDDANRQRASAAELVGLAPDLIVADGTPGLTAVRLATRTVPIIFANVLTHL